MENKIQMKLENTKPIYSFKFVYGFDEMLCADSFAARPQAVTTAVAVVIAILSAIVGYFLITIISGFAALSGGISLFRLKSRTEKRFAEKGEQEYDYEFFTDGFSVKKECYAAFFPYEKVEKACRVKQNIILRIKNGTEFLVPIKDDSGFVRFINEKTAKGRM